MTSNPSDRPAVEPGLDLEGQGLGQRPRPAIHRSRLWGAALAAGLAAGLLGWLLGEPIHARFNPPKFVNTASSSGGFLSTAAVYQLDMAKQRAQILDACLVFGAFGMVVGAALAVAGSWARGVDRATTGKRALAGLILGGLLVAAVTGLALPVYYGVHNPDTNDLLTGLLCQAVLSAAVGAAGGAALGIGLGHRDVVARAAIGGLLGGCAGALAYEVLGAIAFPLDETASPISATLGTRLFNRLAVTTLAAAGAALGVLDLGRRPASRTAVEVSARSA